MSDGLAEHELDTLLICSVRYALGRRTYVVSDVCSIVRFHLGDISANTRKVMRRDIRDALDERRTGDPQDEKCWYELLTRMLNHEENTTGG